MNANQFLFHKFALEMCSFLVNHMQTCLITEVTIHLVFTFKLYKLNQFRG